MCATSSIVLPDQLYHSVFVKRFLWHGLFAFLSCWMEDVYVGIKKYSLFFSVGGGF